jgi:hypothetical protein
VAVEGRGAREIQRALGLASEGESDEGESDEGESDDGELAEGELDEARESGEIEEA